MRASPVPDLVIQARNEGRASTASLAAGWRRGGLVLAPAAACAVAVAIALSVHQFDTPVVLGALLLLAGGVFLLLHPEAATLVVAVLLYSNLPILAHRYHGIPQVLAASSVLLLLIPLCHHVIVLRQPLRGDRTLGLLLVYLTVLLVSSFAAKDIGIAGDRIKTFIAEGLLLYFLVINAVRHLPTLRRVIWALLVTGGVLGALPLYQEVTGRYDQQFGGLAHRNYEFMELREQLRANPDDPDLLERKLAYTKGRAPRANGPTDEPNYFAQLMVLLLPLALFAWRTGRSSWARISAASLGVLTLAGVIVSYSRGALVALMALIALAVCVRWLRTSRLVAIGLGLVVLSPIAAPDYLTQRLSSLSTALDVFSNGASSDADVAVRGRVTEMLAAAQVWRDHPVIGVGPGQYSPFYSEEYHHINPRLKAKDIQGTRRAHSLYLEMAAETGVVGLAVFLAAVVWLLRDLWRARRRWAAMDPERADLATALLLSVAAYLTTAMFLSLAYERYYWFLLALASAGVRAIEGDAPTIAGRQRIRQADAITGMTRFQHLS